MQKTVSLTNLLIHVVHSLLLCSKPPSTEMSISQNQHLYLFNCGGNLIWKQVNQSLFCTIQKSKVIQSVFICS